jgi:hypothetical protein
MWLLDILHLLATAINDLAVGQPARWSIAQVVERDHTADGTVCDLGALCSSEA